MALTLRVEYGTQHSSLQEIVRHSTPHPVVRIQHSALHPVVRHSELRTSFCSETRSTRDFTSE